LSVSDPFEEERPRLGRRGRARYASSSADQRISRPLVIALVGVVAVAAAIFWPRGGGLRLGTDAPVQVVRVDTTVVAPVPRSGDVDIATARQPLVAEKPSPERTTDRDRPLTITSPVEPAAVAPAASAETAPATAGGDEAPVVEPPPVVQPTPDGAYALQVGSFESELGAQSLRDDLLARGYPVHIRAASTGTGAIVYRVWVGYFPNREAAAAYAGAHQESLAGSTPVHR
jgi:cell division septation protein DedD